MAVIQETHQQMRYSERELSLQRGKTTVFDRHEIRLRVSVNSLAIRFGSLSYDDIVQAVQNTIDSCINSATDRHGHLTHLYRTPNPSLVLGCVCLSANILSRTVSVIAAYCSNIIQVIFLNKLHYSVIVNCILLASNQFHWRLR